MIQANTLQTATQLLDFIAQSPTAAHAVASMESRLQDAHIPRWDEALAWQIKAGDCFYFKRHDAALVAVRMGERPPAEVGFHIIATHTDAPCLRLKPHAIYSKAGYLQLGVEIYGSPILATWTDRDLALAGRVISNQNGARQTRLVRLPTPLIRIVQLPIHFNRDVNDQGMILNKQDHLAPILGLCSQTLPDQALEAMLAQALNIEPRAIVDWELELYDTQPGTFAGIENEFIVSGRLDNLAMCHAALLAFLDHKQPTPRTQIFIAYNSEEIGSQTTNGGASSLLNDCLTRITLRGNNQPDDLFRALAQSFLISADAAHAIHPNYPEKYEKEHWCHLNQGPVIKINAQGKYATTAETAASFATWCSQAAVPVQKFVNRTDMLGGGTIGPINAARLGIQTVDVGNAILAMHSIREMAGSADHLAMITVFKQFFME